MFEVFLLLYIKVFRNYQFFCKLPDSCFRHSYGNFLHYMSFLLVHELLHLLESLFQEFDLIYKENL